MALQSHLTERIGAESLEEKWEKVGSGGFGCVYKAWHKKWKFDVAIKLLHNDVSSFIEEANIMNEASSQFVLRVYGIFEGCPPFGRMPTQKGIVMEFMHRGSVQTLQKDLSGPPPWPLAFRLAHEVALGVNFLHSKNLMHSDLKPSNVLLDADLHAKLADFGLSRVSTSALNSNREATGEVGGSYKYMPPEAFEVSYKPVRAFDTYSYGILLWSIVTGKEPYETADYSLVALSIPRGDRPDLEKIDQKKAEGLKELVDLMKMCWDEKPSNRPNLEYCLDNFKDVFSKHESRIQAAVNEVLTKLNPPVFTPLTPELSRFHDTVDHFTPKNSPPDFVSHPTKRMSDTDKATFVDVNRANLIKHVSEVMAIVDELGDMVHGETYSVIESKPTSQEQMRVLFQRAFRPGGVTVKAAFYDILRRDHPTLVKGLGGEL